MGGTLLLFTVPYVLYYCSSLPQAHCWNCGRAATETCSGCNRARYCGQFCQHKDWESHHRVCPVAAAAAAAKKGAHQNGEEGEEKKRKEGQQVEVEEEEGEEEKKKKKKTGGLVVKLKPLNSGEEEISVDN